MSKHVFCENTRDIKSKSSPVNQSNMFMATGLKALNYNSPPPFCLADCDLSELINLFI